MKYDFFITGTIGEAFDWWTGTRGTTANQVKYFLNEHKDQEVTIAVSSLGGYIDDGLAIMEYIKAHGKCNMVIIGMTASAATILCMKAKSVKIARGSMMLIHNSSQMLDVWTSANKEKIDEIIKAFQHEREQLDTIDKCLADIYAMKNGKSIDENLEMMSKEKWLTAKDALDFGLVDSILDDDEEAALKAKQVKNAYAGYTGAAEHYGLPAFAEEATTPQSRSFFQRMREAMSKVTSIMDSAEEPAENNNAQTGDVEINTITNQTNSNMKKLILNLACAILSIEAFDMSEEGKISLTEDQLKQLENALSAKDTEIANLKTEKQTLTDEKATAETAQANLQQQLNDLQKEYDDFKAEAGTKTLRKPAASASEKAEPLTAKAMYESIKSQL